MKGLIFFRDTDHGSVVLNLESGNQLEVKNFESVSEAVNYLRDHGIKADFATN